VQAWLPYLAAAVIAIGKLGPYVPKLTGFGVPAPWVFEVGTVVSYAGAVGALLSNPPLWLKQAIPWLFPVTPEMHAAALTRIVAPSGSTSVTLNDLRTRPTDPPPKG
jgi:hypothetical protein